MKLRNTIAAGLGLAACLCVAIAATTAQQTEERQPYTIHRVTGNALPAAGQQSADEAQASQGVQGVPDEDHRIMVASGTQRVVASEAVDPLRGGVVGICGDTTVTQNIDPLNVLITGSTVACSQVAAPGSTLENAWARCFPSSEFPATDLVLQCIDFGIESNTSGADNPFDIDLRIVALGPTFNGNPLGCPLPVGPPALVFGDEELDQTWFEAPPEFTVLHLQKVRVENDFEGLLKVTLNKLVTVPAGTNLLVEVHAADRRAATGGDAGLFRVGGNEANASGSTYIWSTQCDVNDYQTVESIDPQFTSDFVLSLDGSVGPISGICCKNIDPAGGCQAGVTTFDLCNGPTDRFCPGATDCPTNPDDPFCPNFEGPSSPKCPFIVENDDCAGLIVLSNSACESFNSVIATNSGVVNPPGFDTVNNDVFFGYIVKGVAPLPNNNGRLIVSTFGSNFDTNVAVYRVVSGDITVPADLTDICADIAAGGGGGFAVGQAGGFGDDVENRPAVKVNPLTYICISDPGGTVPGDQFVIRVGSPFPNVGGSGVLNVDYLPISGGVVPTSEWTSGGNPGGQCCMANGDCVMVPDLDDCQALGGFFRSITDFYFGRDPTLLAADPVLNFAALLEISCVGCKTLPCGPVGDNCFNPIDLKQLLQAKLNTAFGTVTRLIRNKLYYKYQIPAGCDAIEIDTCGSTDAIGGGGFDTFIEVFKWSPDYPNNCVNDSTSALVNDFKNGDADSGDLPTLATPVPANTGTLLVVDGQVMINDDCRFDDQPEQTAAQGAAASAPCFNNLGGTETDSCLCFPTNTGQGNDAGDWILICIGQFNTERDQSGINSVDPVENATFDPVLSSLTIRCLTECFNCELDTSGFTIDLVEANAAVNPEGDCMDGVMGTNDGCNAILATSSGGPVTNPQTTPISPTPNVDFYIAGNSGVFDLDGLTQHEDNDWYEIDLAAPAKLTWRLVQAEFIAQIAILRAADPTVPPTNNLCNIQGFLLNTTAPCGDDTLNDLTIDVCAGKYYLTIRPLPPFKPVPCGPDSEYLCCLTVRPQKAVNCCPGDSNNDGILDGNDIQQFVDTWVHPPATGTGLRIGGCYERSFCQADTDANSVLNLADVSQFVNLLITKTQCGQSPGQCIDVDRCQLPDNNGSIGNGALSSDRNPQSFNADPDTPDNFLVADIFNPTTSGSINSVCWWGLYADRDAIFAQDEDGVECMPAPDDDFTITYYKNVFNGAISDFCPDEIKAGPFDVGGSFVANFPATAGPFNAAPSRTATGNIIQMGFGDVTEYRYEVSHPPVPVTAGECCWISIVNNTTGRCTWRWETTPFGSAEVAFHENQNQGLEDFPVKAIDGTPFWDCQRDIFGGGPSVAFCLDILIGPNGCDPVITVLGQCCFLDDMGQQLCVEVTAGECAVNYDGQFASGGTCASPCPPILCVVSCQAGDIREPEGCGFDKNGGCDDNPLDPTIVDLGTLACEESGVGGTPIVLCGTVAGLGADSDWFSFTLNALGNEARITVDIEAQPDLVVQLRERVPIDTPQTDGCSANIATAFSNDGLCDIVTADGGCLPNQEYLVRVISSQTRNVACADSTYRVTISCTAPCCQFPAACPMFAGVLNEIAGPLEILQNDGCDDDPNLFEVGAGQPGGLAAIDICNPAIPANPPALGGTVFCGTSWADQGFNDSDWWLLPTLTVSTEINIQFRSEFPGIVDMVEVGDAPTGTVSDCIFQNLSFSATFAASVNCGAANGDQFAEFNECIPAGTWAIRIGPGTPDGFGVVSGTVPGSARNHYQVRVTCRAIDCTPTCPPESLSSQLPRVAGINTGVGIAGIVTRLASDASLITNFRAADNFLAVSGGTVSAIRWWGFYQNTTLPTTASCVPQTGDVVPDNFTITYYGDTTEESDEPGVGLVSFPDNVVIGGPFNQFLGGFSSFSKVEVAGQRVQINTQPNDFVNLVEFNATHTGVTFDPGTCVWIEIVNNTTGGNCTWSWVVSEDGDLKAAQRDADPAGPTPTTYENGDEFRRIDLAWCLDIKTGPTGCFVFEPASNDVCEGAFDTSVNLTCLLGSGLSDQVTYDLVNYSSQGPLFEPDTLDGFFGGTPGMGHKDCEVNIFFNLTPAKEAVAWFSFTPTGAGPPGTANIVLQSSTFAEIILFNPAGGAPPVDCTNIAGAGEVAGTQLRCALGSAPQILGSGLFVPNQTYLIMVAYYDGLTLGRDDIFDNLLNTLVINCP